MTSQVRYEMDAKVSQFTVNAFASGLAAVVAHSPKFAIRDFTGEAQFVPGTLGEASVSMKIKSSSLELMDEVTEYDRGEIMRVTAGEVLETTRYPEIVYNSSHITVTPIGENLFGAALQGHLTLHGVTKEVNFTAQTVAGEETLRGYGNFVINQSEYGIAVASIAGGTLRMKDELKVAFFIVARKQG